MHLEQLFVKLIYEQDGWQAGWPSGVLVHVTADQEYSTYLQTLSAVPGPL